VRGSRVRGDRVKGEANSKGILVLKGRSRRKGSLYKGRSS